jgi:hypothetical protein
MWMGPDIDTTACTEAGWPHVVEKNKRANHFLRLIRQDAIDAEAIQIFAFTLN